MISDARLLASGLMLVGRHGDLGVLDRLVSLIRRDVLPDADCYGQLLGATAVEPLAWDAFGHLGREAEVATAVLQAALAGRQPAAFPGQGALRLGDDGAGAAGIRTLFRRGAAAWAARAGKPGGLRPYAVAGRLCMNACRRHCATRVPSCL